jgi:hypothetical protein
MIALATMQRSVEDETDWMKPPIWSGNFWGPAATRARLAGQLPPLPMNAAMTQWNRWGREVLREGDVVFRLGDARALRGIFHLSWFIARATGSPFSHTGIVAVEDGSPLVYDCSAEGVRRLPFEAWMLECVGSLGVKRLKPEHRRHIPGVVGFCRAAFDQQVPFDFGFRLDDSALYCLEMTEKAFRSQGLKLSEPLRIGDWEHLSNFPITALAMADVTRLAVGRPITLDQLVYVPGNDRHGIWASPLLETVFGPEPKGDPEEPTLELGHLSLRGDLKLTLIAAGELQRSYSDQPIRLIHEVAGDPWVRKLLTTWGPDERRAGPKDLLEGARRGVRRSTDRTSALPTRTGTEAYDSGKLPSVRALAGCQDGTPFVSRASDR